MLPECLISRGYGRRRACSSSRHDLDADIAYVRTPGFVQNPHRVPPRPRRGPRETLSRLGASEKASVGEPEERAARIDRPKIDGDGTRQPDRIDRTARRRCDLRRARISRRLGALARGKLERLASGHAGFTEEAEHVGGPELVDLAPGERPFRAHRTARARVDDDGPMQGADLDRRLARNEPRRRALAAVRV